MAVTEIEVDKMVTDVLKNTITNCKKNYETELEVKIKKYEGVIWNAVASLKRGFRVKTGRFFVHGESGIEYVELSTKSSTAEVEFIGGFVPDEFERQDFYSAACMAIWEVVQHPAVEYWAVLNKSICELLAQGNSYDDLVHKIYIKRIYSAVRKEAYMVKKEKENVTKSYDEAIAGKSYDQKELSDGFLSAMQVLEKKEITRRSR